MSPHGFTSRTLAPLATIVFVATTTSMAHARMVDTNINAHISQSMTTTLDQRGHPGWPSWGTAPPPAAYNGPHRWQTSDDTGGGGTGGFSPGGGSGTTPKKKPNQQ
jgi:hypothetical protein